MKIMIAPVMRKALLIDQTDLSETLRRNEDASATRRMVDRNLRSGKIWRDPFSEVTMPARRIADPLVFTGCGRFSACANGASRSGPLKALNHLRQGFRFNSIIVVQPDNRFRTIIQRIRNALI